MRQQLPRATIEAGFYGRRFEVEPIRGAEPSVLISSSGDASKPPILTPAAARILAALLVAAANEAEMDR